MERRVDLDEPDDSSADELEFESGDDLDLVEEDLGFSDWTHVDNHSDRYVDNDSTFFGLHGMHPRFDDVEPKDSFVIHCFLMNCLIYWLTTPTSERTFIFLKVGLQHRPACQDGYQPTPKN